MQGRKALYFFSMVHKIKGQTTKVRSLEALLLYVVMTVFSSEVNDGLAHWRKVTTKHLMHLVECFECFHQKKIHT